jgi:hypothetical protein
VRSQDCCVYAGSSVERVYRVVCVNGGVRGLGVARVPHRGGTLLAPRVVSFHFTFRYKREKRTRGKAAY